MSFIEPAPWSQRRLAVSEIEMILLEKLAGKSCWRYGKYLGSMLYFDFGVKIKVPNKRHGEVWQGECIAGIRDCYWQLKKDELLIVDSDKINDYIAEDKLSIMDGKFFTGIRTEKGRISLFFSEGIVLQLDSSNKYCTTSNIAEFIMGDGRIYSISPRGYFYLTDEVSTIRLNNRAR